MALNYPVGESMGEGLRSDKLETASFLKTFFVPAFSGYVVVTAEGFAGMEEGVLFFRDGFPVGSAFSYDFFDVQVFGDASLDSFFNALAAKHGVVDVYRLSKQQIELILALDERTALNASFPAESLPKKVRSSYDPSFARSTVQGLDKMVTRSDELLKRIGLGGLSH